MENRTVFAFLAGFASCCAALYAAGNHSPAIYFALGSVATSTAHVALGMASNRVTPRFRRRVRVAPQGAPAAGPGSGATGAGLNVPASHLCRSAVNPIEADVVSALVNFKATKPQARELARQACARAGDGAPFEQVMRLALQGLRRTV